MPCSFSSPPRSQARRLPHTPHNGRSAFSTTDLPRLIQLGLARRGVDEAGFPAYLRRIDEETARRLEEGTRDELVYYALQSRRFTRLAPIEPALSARAFVDGLQPAQRERLLSSGWYVPPVPLPAAERARLDALLEETRSASADPWLSAFAPLARDGKTTADAFLADYVRVARFLYRKEFVATADAAAERASVAVLYQARPHSSDTRADTGFSVYTGLAALRGLEPGLRVRRVLIVGPGLDTAPRTDLVDAVAPQSYQPFAVADALIGLTLATIPDLRVHSVDVSPRVVGWFDALPTGPLTIHFLLAAPGRGGPQGAEDYVAYLASMGRAIGRDAPTPPSLGSDPHYLRSVDIRPDVLRALAATRLDILTERLAGEPPFDLAVMTNVLTYFDDEQLGLALTNVAAMLRPGGFLIHNESRRGLAELSSAIGLPAVHMRTSVIGGPAARPLHDAVWIHKKDG